MKIYCIGCMIYLGEILKGSKLKKGIQFLCENCDRKRIASDMKKRADVEKNSSDFNNIFGGFFK